MDYQTYLAQLRADGLRIGSRARQPGALTAGVPDCPGWQLTDLLTHLGRIYRFVVAGLELGRSPVEGSFEAAPASGVDPLDWFDAGHRALLTHLEDRGPEDPAWSWWPADQTHGFWARRMCHETLVHRLDADGALEFHAGVTPKMATDGIDEVLTRFVARPAKSTTRVLEPVSVEVISGGRRWLVIVDQHVAVTAGPHGHADATVFGEPIDVLRWSWGRAPFAELTIGGDPAALDVVRAVVTEAAG